MFRDKIYLQNYCNEDMAEHVQKNPMIECWYTKKRLLYRALNNGIST